MNYCDHHKLESDNEPEVEEEPLLKASEHADKDAEGEAWMTQKRM